MIVTRIAPSPTGMFHLGTARTAYFNWLMARSNNGKFIVRIDDTDTDRNRVEFTDVILDSLRWLGLNDFDMIFSQSSRLARYQEVAELLLATGNAQRMDDGSIVFMYQGDWPTVWNDMVAGDVKVSNQDATISSMTVIMRNNGMPTYNFSTVIDDIDTGITHVIRGNDHISNTLRQIFLRNTINKILGINADYKFGHIGLIHKDGKKLSKRDGAADLLTYKQSGYSAEAILAYIVKLGWNVSDPEIDKKHPIIDRATALALFSSGKMRSAPSNFDQSKLDWINNKMKK